jgi:hypothetical protein
MRAKIIGTAVFAIIAMVGLALAQETIGTPPPAAAPKSDVGVGVRAGESQMPAGPTANDWRYRWFEGRWWYWTPQNRWMWYGDDGRWIDFDANQAPLAIERNDASPVYQGYYPGGYYYPWPGYYYRAPRYWNGYYYPGYYSGVGVDVWGPHGAVRAGRVRVGW